MRTRGFTLIELLVVIAIIGILSSVVVVSLNAARAKARDAKRISDIHQIQKAVEIYNATVGLPPAPAAYGRGNSSPGNFDTWWDLSTNDPSNFMSFLKSSGVMPQVSVDPVNDPASFNGVAGAAGHRYFYFFVPANYLYQGGACRNNAATYMLGITDLETDASRPSTKFSGGGCSCLWNNAQNFFDASFDYVVCGSVS
ncbi:MAG: prepilin-type N-terminal cleavage/methylation domain-containing protein [bacterium]